MQDGEKLTAIWNQKDIPVVLRRDSEGELLRVRLPFAEGNYSWLRNDRPRKPKWIERHKYWELPKKWFNDFVDRALKRYGAVYVVQPFREQEICARACMEATGHDCQCSCMGAKHGAGMHGRWFEASDAFATRWQDRELACRLMTAKQEGAQ